MLGQAWSVDGEYPQYLVRAGLDREIPVSLYEPGTWVCSLCYCVTWGPYEGCYSKGWKGRFACKGNVFQHNAGWVREPEYLTKRRSKSKLEETRQKNKKLRRRMDNAQSAIRATATVGKIWVCKAWSRAKGDLCGAQNLMVRWHCYACGYVIRPWDWMKLAQKQGFDMETEGEAQNALLTKNRNLRGARAGREEKTRSRKKLKKKKKKGRDHLDRSSCRPKVILKPGPGKAPREPKTRKLVKMRGSVNFDTLARNLPKRPHYARCVMDAQCEREVGGTRLCCG